MNVFLLAEEEFGVFETEDHRDKGAGGREGVRRAVYSSGA